MCIRDRGLRHLLSSDFKVWLSILFTHLRHTDVLFNTLLLSELITWEFCRHVVSPIPPMCRYVVRDTLGAQFISYTFALCCISCLYVYKIYTATPIQTCAPRSQSYLVSCQHGCQHLESQIHARARAHTHTHTHCNFKVI